MVEAAGSTSTGDDEIRLFATSVGHDPDGVELAYLALEHVATRHRLSDAWLVLHPTALGPQVFRRGRLPITSAAVAELAARPVGLYTQPDVVAPAVRAALAGLCNVALSAHALRIAAPLDATSGLASRNLIEASLVRAAARASRYGWSFTAVLLTTAGTEPEAERWLALCDALRAALRSGDEVGGAGPGRALAILGNAGPDVVRPFVARVHTALSAAGADETELHVATVSSPLETVDPEAVLAMLGERLDELVIAAQGDGRRSEPEVNRRFHQLPPGLELELRSLPGVVGAAVAPHPSGVGNQITLITLSANERLRSLATRRIREHRVEAPIEVVVAGTATTPPHWTPPEALLSAPSQANEMHQAHTPPPSVPERFDVKQNGANGRGSLTPRQLSVTAPPRLVPDESGGPGAISTRITLSSATFDTATGTSEVTLARGPCSGVGRAAMGPLAGGAQATLTALGELGIPIPYYLVSAERAHTVPGEPVVVVLSPRHTADEATEPSEPLTERIGVATGTEDVAAASRATLSALNRYLSGAQSSTWQ